MATKKLHKKRTFKFSHSKPARIRRTSNLFRGHSKGVVDAGVQELPLSKAKAYLGRLLASAVAGKIVYIRSGMKRFQLQYIPEIEPIPIRPPGYFNDMLSPEEIDLENKLAKSSVIEAPDDL
jgi:hypothetical protein